MARGRRKARRALPRRPLPRIDSPEVAAECPDGMINAAGDVFYPDNPEDAAYFAERHGAKPLYPRQLTTEELTGGKDDTALDAELAAALRKLPVCTHCGGRHTRACPRVKRMQFHPNGALAAVEFWPAGKWDETEIIWPEELINE